MSVTVLIAGGGTGGHLFPGVAVARELVRLSPGLRAVFVGTGRALEARVLAEAGFEHRALKVRAFRGRGLLDRLRSLASLPAAVAAAMGLLARLRPALVLAVGGYAAFPLGVAAWLRRVPLAVQEQNSVPGLTNRLLARLARLAFVSFEAALVHFPRGRARFTGNPVRPELVASARRAAQSRPDPARRFELLVLGGSQGAASLNRAMSEAAGELAAHQGRLRITHQTGPRDAEAVAAAYAAAGMPAEVAPFFNDVGALYGRSHLVLCRAGAGTISELACCGRASLLVPYPFAAGDHQRFNAEALAATGAARVIPDRELSGPLAARLVTALMADESRRLGMERAAAEQGRPDAAESIASACLRLAGEAA